MMNKKQSNISFKTKKQPIWHFWVDLTMVSSMFSDSCPRRWPGSSTGFSTILHGCSFKKPYSLCDPGVERG